MVKYQDQALDRTFAALADPTRRAMLAQLSAGTSVSVSELAKPFPMSLPAVMKHLDVLSDAGLVTRTKTGRIVACALTPEPMEDAMHWLNHYLRFWSEQLERLAAFLEENTCPPNPKSRLGQASPSNVISMPRRKKSTKRGPTPKKS
jgi:DNA-binding transcriptional ArsR family regulator